jgi:hypothetical protein
MHVLDVLDLSMRSMVYQQLCWPLVPIIRLIVAHQQLVVTSC